MWSRNLNGWGKTSVVRKSPKIVSVLCLKRACYWTIYQLTPVHNLTLCLKHRYILIISSYLNLGNERRCRVISTHSPSLGGYEFKLRFGHWLSWRRLFVGFLSPSQHIHDRFLPHPFQFSHSTVYTELLRPSLVCCLFNDGFLVTQTI
jgi:hypothetical protein